MRCATCGHEVQNVLTPHDNLSKPWIECVKGEGQDGEVNPRRTRRQVNDDYGELRMEEINAD